MYILESLSVYIVLLCLYRCVQLICAADEMEDSAMYGVNNHSMGSILAPPISYDYNLTDSFAPVSHGRTEDICDILEQIVSISSQSLDEAQMRLVAVRVHVMLLGKINWF